MMMLTIKKVRCATMLASFSFLLLACGGSDKSTNSAPVANAGSDKTYTVGSEVTLDGSKSYDANGDNLSFSWNWKAKPVSSNVAFDAITAKNPKFNPDVSGSYEIALMVNDGSVNSDEDTLIITALNNGVDITNAKFIRTDGDCNQYQGDYFANVMDIQRGLDFSSSVIISPNSSDCQLQSNNIPNHDFNDGSAHFHDEVAEQTQTFGLRGGSSFAASVTPLGLNITNGVFLNGVVLDLLAAACYGVGPDPLGNEKIGCGQNEINNPWRYDPMSPLNRFGTDRHNAHTQPDGTYHYHGDPVAMYEEDCVARGEVSPVIGFAADGFPIFGPCILDSNSGVIKKAKSSYRLKSGTRQAVSGYQTPVSGQGVVGSNNYDGQFTGDWQYQGGSGDLDECNGATINGQYGYYITDSYPWIMACFKSQVDASFTKVGPRLINRMHGHE